MLGDAHAGIFIPRRKSIIKKHLANDERLFPLHVSIDGDNRIYLTKASDAKAQISIGSEILSINGRTATDIVAEMLRHKIGDNTKHQRVLLGRNFSEEYWAIFGGTSDYNVEYLKDNTRYMQMLAGSKIFLKPFSADRSFDSLFSYKLLNATTGYIRIETMVRKYKDDFLAFSKEAFKYFKNANITNLIIDVSDNGGGANPLWQQGVMPYIADKPFRYTSSYKARVTADNAGPGDTIGEVVTGVIDNMTPPDLDNPLRFKGDVYVLIGDMTYSSAIHFTITLQDHDIAKVVGTSTGGRAGTTGNAKEIFLPATGIEIDVPVVLYSRPNGKDNMLAVQPDIVVQQDLIDPEQAIKKFADDLAL